jgi:hypothetical protein
MPIHYLVHENILEVVCFGVYSLSEMEEAIAAFTSDPAVSPSMPILINLLDSENKDRTTQDIHQIANLFHTHAHQIHPRMAVAAPNTFHFGMARMLSVFLEKFKITLHVCRDYNEAKAWLGSSKTPTLTDISDTR